MFKDHPVTTCINLLCLALRKLTLATETARRCENCRLCLRPSVIPTKNYVRSPKKPTKTGEVESTNLLIQYMEISFLSLSSQQEFNFLTLVICFFFNGINFNLLCKKVTVTYIKDRNETVPGRVFHSRLG